MGIAEKTFNRGEIIIKEGDIGKSFFRLMEGTAGVYSNFGKKDEFRLGAIESEEFFGEMAILEAYPRSATIVAETPVKVIEIPEKEMNAYFSENQDQIIELMRHLGARIKAMTKDYNEATALLKEIKEADEGKKKSKSLFSKIKKHVDLYQANKNKITEPSTDSLRKALKDMTGDGTGKLESYRRGMVVYNQNDPGDCMYILHSGIVNVFKDYGERTQQQLAELRGISFFGEMGLAAGEKREATVIVDSDGTLIEVIREKDMKPILRSCPAKFDAILRNLSYRLRRLNIDFLNTCKEITENYDPGEEDKK